MDPRSQTTDLENALRREGPAYGENLSEEGIARLGQYFALVQRWNPRLHLVAPCPATEFATRHVLESLTALRFLGEGARVADLGSGAGLPIIPCLIVRPDLSARLIEASPKKSVFLREAIATLELKATVIAERFERNAAPEVQFVTCRALEQFAVMLPELIRWAPVGATMLLFGGDAIETELKKLGRVYQAVRMPNSNARYLFVVEPLTCTAG